MMGANGAVLFSLLIYAVLLYGAVRLIHPLRLITILKKLPE